MYKVGVCGHFGGKRNLLEGQTVKTKTLTEEIIRYLGVNAVQIVDTYKWTKNPFYFFIKCVKLHKKCKDIVILPAQNGVKVLTSLFLFLNRSFNRKLFYVVIGGWLPELLEKNNKLKNRLYKFSCIYVETHSMVEALEKLGFQNVKYLPNFKRLDILDENKLVYPTEEPYKLCTFSRVMKEKGIEDAIEAVMNINNTLGREVYTLDIYGQIEGNYIRRFEELKNNFPQYISYKGIVNFNDSVEVLKEYFALLFPTYYEGEGFAGTILDAYSSGVPVIATDWKYNGEIIQNKLDGLIYEYEKPEMLKEILLEIYHDPTIITIMKKNCLKRAKEYMPEIIVNSFIKHL